MVGEVNQNPVLTALTAEIREHAALTSAIKSGKKCDSTKEQYKRKQIHFEDWIENKRPALIDTEKWLVNIDAATMEDFMGHICQKKDKFGEYFTPPKFQSYDHVNGYKSAILDMYEIQNVKPTTAIKDMFNDFAKGYKRKIASLKQQGEIKITEGKAPLTFQGYRFLSKKAVEQKTDFTWAIFAWMFLLFCWNLMARCVSVSGIMFDHIGWEGDAMTIIFPKHKGDQEGEHSAPKHVYANPRNPEICPILAFAVFIWTIGFRRDGAKRTLFGDTKHTEERFSAWLRKMLGSAAEDLILMGIAIIEIGTHSFRKGIASFLACLTGGPSAIAIYLRAGWSLGAVTARYIIEGGGGDQLCGRAATGICIMEASFADLPPHFNLSDGPVLTVEEWEEILPYCSTFYPTNFRIALAYLLASLVFHQDWIKETFDPHHPIFISRVWTSGVLNRLRSKIYTGCLKNDVTGLCATGIPPHVVLQNGFKAMEVALNTKIDNMEKKIDEIPEKVKQSILDNFQVNGTVPITHSQIVDMFNTFQQNVLNVIQSNNSNAQQQNEPVALNFSSWTWGGRIHPVPIDFAFPKCNLKLIWDLWWCGCLLYTSDAADE